MALTVRFQRQLTTFSCNPLYGNALQPWGNLRHHHNPHRSVTVCSFIPVEASSKTVLVPCLRVCFRICVGSLDRKSTGGDVAEIGSASLMCSQRNTHGTHNRGKRQKYFPCLLVTRISKTRTDCSSRMSSGCFGVQNSCDSLCDKFAVWCKGI